MLELSTIVEIIRAYQPSKSVHRTGLNLQQQKLLELTSQNNNHSNQILSTIVEIIRAYQPLSLNLSLSLSTIVEIIRAYQPLPFKRLGTHIYNSRNYQSLLAHTLDSVLPILYLQQQKLLELTSHRSLFEFFLISTIVEIIRAYQPLIDCKDTKNPLNKSIFSIFFKEVFLPPSSKHKFKISKNALQLRRLYTQVLKYKDQGLHNQKQTTA